MASTGPSASEERLRLEHAELKARLADTEEALRAIRSGEVDALVVESTQGPRLFVLDETDVDANRFRSEILAKVSEAIVTIDEDRRVIYLNAAAEQRYDVLAANVLGQPLTAIYRNRWLAPTDEANAWSTLTTSGQWRGRTIHVKRDGTELYVETSVSRLISKEGQPAGMLGVIRDITAEVVAAEALRKTGARLHDALAAANLGTWNLDTRTGKFTSDDRFQRIFGLTVEGLSAQLVSANIHPDDIGWVTAAVEAATRPNNPSPYDVEYRVRHPDGSVRWVAAKGSARFLETTKGRELAGFEGTVEDITKRKRAEMDARFLAAIGQDLASLGDVTAIVETVGAKLGAHLGLSLCNFVEVNEAADETVVTHAWHRPDVPSSIGRHKLSEYFSAEFQQSLRAGKPFVVRDTAIDPRTSAAAFAALKMGAFICMPLVREGRWYFMMNVHHSTAHDWSAEEIGLVRELTTRVWTRLERVRIESDLRESEGRFRAIADNIPHLAWIANSERVVDWFNQRWLDYTGTTLADNAGTGWKAVYHPDYVEAVAEKFERHLREGLDWEDTFPLRGKDGSYRWFLSRMKVIRDASGQIVRFFGTNTDVTDQRAIEEKLRAAKEAAESANKSKDRFLAVLSHELRTPLTPVLLTVETLAADQTLPAEVRDDLATIKHNIELETTLIDDLLDVSRITNGKVALKKEPLDLNDAVRQASAVCQQQLREAEVKFEFALANTPLRMTADPARLQQVLWNVLKNAIKFTPSGGTVWVSTTRQDSGRLEVRVRDSGIGIPAEFLPRIFDAFEQADANVTRQFGGLGLGLAISKALLELHGGTIRAESAGLGQGASFFMHLPEDATPLHAGTVSPLSVSAAEAKGPTDLRLLVVEDHVPSAQTLQRLLVRAGHRVTLAHSVFEALTCARRESFDLLLTDLGLPDGMGYEVMSKLQEIRTTPGVVMSGYGMDADLKSSSAAGFTAHVVKPFKVADLLAAIRQAMITRA